MKSYDEMAQSVLIRAEKERMIQKRRNRNIVLSVIACACCLACAILVGIRLNTPEPQDPMLNDVTASTAPEPSATETDPIPKESHEITLLSRAEDGTYVQMLNDVVLPYYMQLRIKDVRGLTEEEEETLKREEKAIANAMIKRPVEYTSISQYCVAGILSTRLAIGWIKVTIEDFVKVEDIILTTTGVGVADRDRISNYNPEDNTDPGMLGVSWRPSFELHEKLAENPDMKVSDIRDTITITIKFKDGTVATAVVDLTFDDEGMAYIVQRGITVN